MHRRTVVHRHHQTAQALRAVQRLTRRDGHEHTIASHAGLSRCAVSQLHRLLHGLHREAIAGQHGGIKTNVDAVGHTANGVHIAGATHALEFDF